MKNKIIENYEKKVFRTIRDYKLVEKNDKIFVAMSGGKDSTAALLLMKKYIKEKNIDCELFGFFINFDLPPTDKLESSIKEQTKLISIPLVVCNVKDFGLNMKKISKLPRPICSSCGIIKRYLMNIFPREHGANKLATGHHGDDLLVFFLKNIISKKFDSLAKFSPLISYLPKTEAVVRIKPLFFVSGEDNRKYCESKDFLYVKEDVCPHVYLKCDTDKSRGKWYKTLENIQEINPHFREDMLNGILNLSKKISSSVNQPSKCKKCGELTNAETCAFCRIKEAQNK